ncbi:MAG: hypothetical protein ACE5JO_01700 [Candidatus Binatia bacterium]
MPKIIVVLGVVAMVALLFVPRVRAWLLEEVKAVSDIAVVFFLRLTSQFGSELTEEGKAEQKLWRERRLRNLQGLALRSRQRWGEKSK